MRAWTSFWDAWNIIIKNKNPRPEEFPPSPGETFIKDDDGKLHRVRPTPGGTEPVIKDDDL